MPISMQVTDEVRSNILTALSKKNAVVPNIRQIKRSTNYHMATIKSSLDFLEKKKVIDGFGPKIGFRNLGYKLEAIEIMQVDMSKKDLFKKFTEAVKNDPHIYTMASIIGSGNWNIMTRHFYKDIESYNANIEKNYYRKIDGLYDLIKDKQIFYATEPLYKIESRTESILEALRKEKAMQ